MALRSLDYSAYRMVFAPVKNSGPSGFATPPRPFVIRASHLDGHHLQPGDTFSISWNVFVALPGMQDLIGSVVGLMAELGLGPSRGSGELVSTEEAQAIEITSKPHNQGTRLLVRFRTPTELSKRGDDPTDLCFPFLFARIRDRVSNLRASYGSGTMPIDFQQLGERARQVRIVRSAVTYQAIERRSSRTRQTHPIGGFTGEVEYEGSVAEFLPFFEAARYTGIGRHAAWGNGEIDISSG